MDTKIKQRSKYTRSEIDHIYNRYEALVEYASEVAKYWVKINKLCHSGRNACGYYSIELGEGKFIFSYYDGYEDASGWLSYECLTQSDYKAFLDKKLQDEIDEENKKKANIKAEKELKQKQEEILKEEKEKAEYERLKKKYG